MSEVVFISGASAGLGRAFAEALAKRGRTLLLVARRRAKLEEVAAECRRRGAKVHPLVCDLLDERGRESLWEEVQSFGRVHLLINNAGFGTYGAEWQLDLSRQKAMVTLHCTVTLEVVHALVPSMVQAKKGSVINVSSIGGFLPSPYMATYSATKSFLTSFSLALSAELAPLGIRVLCFCPGPTETEFQKVAGMPESSLVPMREPQEVVRQALADLRRGKWLSVPGWENKTFYALTRFAPMPQGVALAERVLRRQLRIHSSAPSH